MQISVTSGSKEKVPYKTLFLALIYTDNRYGLEISCWGSNQSCKYMDNVKEFRDKIKSDSDSRPQHTIICFPEWESKLKILNLWNWGNEAILLGTY